MISCVNSLRKGEPVFRALKKANEAELSTDINGRFFQKKKNSKKRKTKMSLCFSSNHHLCDEKVSQSFFDRNITYRY